MSQAEATQIDPEYDGVKPEKVREFQRPTQSKAERRPSSGPDKDEVLKLNKGRDPPGHPNPK